MGEGVNVSLSSSRTARTGSQWLARVRTCCGHIGGRGGGEF